MTPPALLSEAELKAIAERAAKATLEELAEAWVEAARNAENQVSDKFQSERDRECKKAEVAFRAAIAALRQPAPAESDRERAKEFRHKLANLTFDEGITALATDYAAIRREALLAAANTMMRLQAKSSSKQASDDIAVFRAEAFTAIRNLIDAAQPEEPQR